MELIFIIIPVFNEEPGILRRVIEGLLPLHYHIVLIDDGSANNVPQILSQYPVCILSHPVNLGQGAALQTGFEYARGKKADYIVTFDADGQHDSRNVDVLLSPLLRGETDITLGSRFLEGSFHDAPYSRKLMLLIGRFMNTLFTGVYLSDSHNGLRGLNRLALERINITENRMAHATEIILQIKKEKLRFKEVPVHIYYTAYSKKKGQTGWDSVRIFFDLILHKLFK